MYLNYINVNIQKPNLRLTLSSTSSAILLALFAPFSKANSTSLGFSL